MRKGLAGSLLVCLALAAKAAPAVAAASEPGSMPLSRTDRLAICRTDEERTAWLTACAWAVRETSMKAALNDPSGLESSDRIFSAAHHLAQLFVGGCFRLLPEPQQRSPKALNDLTLYGWPPRAVCPEHDLQAWLERCVQDADSLRPGTLRQQVLESFRVDGGLNGFLDTRFVHKRCGVLKIQVQFSRHISDVAEREGPDDQVETVEAYIGFPLFD